MIKANWKWVVAVVIVCFLLLGAYGTGRYLQPAQIIEKERVVTKVEEKIVYQDRVVEKVVYVQAKAKRRETTKTKTPDGTVVEKTVVDTRVDTRVDGEKVEEKIVYQDRVVEKVVEKEKLVTAFKPDWRLGVLVGLDVYTALGQHQQPIPQLGPVTLGVVGERRILGPFSLGVWATTSAQVGLLANVEF